MKIGVIGAGVMGRGVAQCFAQAKHEVVLLDLKQEVLDGARQDIYDNLRMLRLFKKSADLEEPNTIMERIQFTTKESDMARVDYLIENITENEGAKEAVYRAMDEICDEACIFIANTSCISITKLASFTSRQSRFIGVHFMNPVPLKNTVEIIKGYHTSEETLDKVLALLQSAGKDGVIVNDLPGFVSNRLSHLLMNEAAYVVQDNVATAEAVDEIFRKCYGHAMGPLETADLIGLDTVVNSLQILYDSYQDPKFRCCPLLKKMVDAGLLGKKSGQGFYTY